MKFVRIMAAAIFAVGTQLCISAPGDEPATQPSVAIAPDQTQPPANLAQLRRALRALAGRPHGVAPYTQDEWNEMMVFLRQYSPARAHVLENLRLSQTAPIRLDIIQKWRNYNFAKEHFPELADQMLTRFSYEDELFDLMLKAQADDSGLGDEYYKRIHYKITQLVNENLTERQMRIDKLESVLSEEKQRLARDQANETKIVDRRTNAIMASLEKSNPELAPATTQPSDHEQIQDVKDPQPAQ